MLQVHKILNPKLMKKVCVKVLGLSEGIEASQNRKAKSPDIAVRAIAYRVAVRTGLEPATPGVTGRYSNRLNYRTTEYCITSGVSLITGVDLYRTNLDLMPGSSLLSHGEAPHYHRRCGVSLLSSAWGQVGPPRSCRQANSLCRKRISRAAAALAAFASLSHIPLYAPS